MTEEELNRARKGFDLRSDINAYHNKLTDLKNDREFIGMNETRQINVAHSYIDADLIVDAFTKQIKRYEQKIAELQKEFDEL